jgi:HEAT repeat protein
VNNGTETLDVRQESVRSIGRIGTTEARGVLMTVASSGGDLSLRKSAIQELGRSFGEAAVPDLQVLLNDTDEAIRQSTIRALGRVGSTAALDLLRTVAASDASAVIRAHAEAALASKVTAATTPN